MPELDGFHHRLFGNFLRARLDHHDRIRRAHHHDVYLAVAHLTVGRVGDKLPIHISHAHRADRAQERDIGDGQRRRSAVNGGHVGIILCVGRQHERNHLRLALEPLREQRPHRPVNHPAGQNFALARPPFAFDKSAGNSPAGIGVLAVVHGKWKEIDPLARLGIRDRGGKHHVVAYPHDGCAMRLLGNLACFKFKGFTAGELNTNFGCFWFHVSILLFFWAGGIGRTGPCAQDELVPIDFERWTGHTLQQFLDFAPAALQGGGTKGEAPRFYTTPARRFSIPLLTDAKFRDDALVALRIVRFQVVEQATTLADQHE